jgi:hypothetical protein
MFYPREAERDHLFNRVTLLTIACIVLLSIAVMARKDGIRYGALLVNPVETLGTVTLVEFPPRNSEAGLVHYRYSDNSQDVHEGEYFDPHYSAGTQYESGDAIALQYCRWLPSISSSAEQLPGLVPGFYIMVGTVVLALLLLGISWLTICQISRMRAEDAHY